MRRMLWVEGIASAKVLGLDSLSRDGKNGNVIEWRRQEAA